MTRRRKRERKRSREAPREEHKVIKGTTEGFHTDNRETLVLVGKELYKLTPAGTTMKAILRGAFSQRPHVRYLNAIPERTATEQREKNKDIENFAEISKENFNGRDPKKITSMQKAIAEGANVPEVVTKLLKEKEAAKKGGDTKRAASIRKQLRKLDYRRYTNEQETE